MKGLRTLRRFALPLCAATCLTLLPGCWSRVEINDRALVTGFFIDKSDQPGQVELTLGFPLTNRMTSPTQAGTTGGTQYAFVSKSGENIVAAFRKIQTDVPRRISWGHTRIVVIGKQLAEETIVPVLEFVAREPAFHLNTYLMIAPGKASEVTEMAPVFERLPSEVLREYSRQSLMLHATVKDFLMASGEDHGDMVTSLLRVTEKPLISEKGKVKTVVGTDGAAVFKNGRLIDTLSVEEMRSAMWLRNQIKNAVISVPAPTNGKLVSVLVEQTETTVKPAAKGDNVLFKIGISAATAVVSNESDMDMHDPNTLLQLETLLSGRLKDRLQQLLVKTQSLGADCLNLGQYVEWRKPQLWSRVRHSWRDTYRNNVQFEIQTAIKIKQTGAIRSTVRFPAEDAKTR